MDDGRDVPAICHLPSAMTPICAADLRIRPGIFPNTSGDASFFSAPSVARATHRPDVPPRPRDGAVASKHQLVLMPLEKSGGKIGIPVQKVVAGIGGHVRIEIAVVTQESIGAPRPA